MIRFRRALQRFDPRYISLSPTNAARNGAERGLAISRFPLDFIIELDRVAQKTIEILNPFFPRANLVSFASRLLRLCYDNDVCRFRAPLPSLATPLSVRITVARLQRKRSRPITDAIRTGNL